MVMEIEGHRLKGACNGEGTCVIFPDLKIAFGMGLGQPAIDHGEDVVILITCAHPQYMANVCRYVVHHEQDGKMNPPTIIVPIDFKDHMNLLLEISREMHDVPLNVNLIGLAVGEEFQLGEGLILKGFWTNNVTKGKHGLGFIVYSMEQKLKQEYATLNESEIKRLESSGLETTYTVMSPEIAFTGKTSSEFIVDPGNIDVLRAKILLVECACAGNKMTVEHVRSIGSIHFSEILNYADRFENKAIVLYEGKCCIEEIEAAMSALPPSLVGRVYALLYYFGCYVCTGNNLIPDISQGGVQTPIALLKTIVIQSKGVEQCKNKVDNLKKRYKLERHRTRNGCISASHWPWFKKMEQIVCNSLPMKNVVDNLLVD